MVNSWEPLYSGNYMKSKKANKKFDFKVFTETSPKTSLITDGTQQSLAMLLEIYDFPPYGGYFDAHSIWHLATFPLTILWWSFIRDDAEFRTFSLLKKSKTKAK
ncbi:hypothetical protein DY000_02009745 [Brassica cretica]|uniref:Post-GPI attachment to proteins factor 3 n=1 Tax=Brassica cretica TaxID=69181 RepID=A0ABQ7C966_BRACR|nr:hypothetical protein DY000_02009745 [Brassica cretica]